MARLRDLKEAAPADVVEVSPSKVRGDALSDAALMTKRAADALLESDDGRTRALASAAGAAGVLSLMFVALLAAGVGHAQWLALLAGGAMLVPTAFAFFQATEGTARVAASSYERGVCQAVAGFAKRLGEAAADPAEKWLVALGFEALVNAQLDALYRDLDRSRHHLQEAGMAGDPPAVIKPNDRVLPDQASTLLTSGDGRRYPVRIIDLSHAGVALKGRLPPLYPGEQVHVGGRRALVGKVLPGAVALQLATPILPSEFNKRIVL